MEPKKILLNLVLTTIVIYFLASSNLIPGVAIGGIYSALVVAGLMGLLNVAARMVIVSMRIPIVLMTLWITTVVLNTGILLFINQFMDSDQFSLSEGAGLMFLEAFLAALVISAAQAITAKIFD